MRYFESVVTLALDQSACLGCGRCTEVCPHGVFEIVDKRAILADRGACMECGACALNCQHDAISVRSGVGCAAAILAGTMGRGNECAPSAQADGRTSCGCA